MSQMGHALIAADASHLRRDTHVVRSRPHVAAVEMATAVATDAAPPKIAILMCTYHGQRYLADQLESIRAQTHTNWELWVSDDGSRDETHAILKQYRSVWGADRMFVREGPAERFSTNFLSLTCKNLAQADYFAYSDQDDIWEPDKLERALAWLETVPAGIPALYCSRTRLVDAENRDIGFSPLFKRPPSFANALMQNVGGGNTMVFNRAACEILRKAGDQVEVVTHDWWAYMAVTACGGKVFYDQNPSIRYRQHADNLVGMNGGWSARCARVRMLWQGRFREWNDLHIKALQRLHNEMTAENRKILVQFEQARNASLLPRLAGIIRSGVYRQTTLGNIGLVAAAVFKKI